MSSPPSPPPPPTSPVRSGPARFRYGVEAAALLVVLVFAGAVLLPTWLQGGFTQQKRPGLPRTQVGRTVANGEFRIRPIGAKLQDEHPAGEFQSKKGMAYLVMQVTVENLTKRPEYAFDDLMLLSKPVFTKPTPPDDTGVVRDNSSVSVLEPRVPETLQLIWAVPDTLTPRIKDDLDLTLQRQSYTEGFFEQRYRWSDPQPWLVVVTPVVRESS